MDRFSANRLHAALALFALLSSGCASAPDVAPPSGELDLRPVAQAGAWSLALTVHPRYGAAFAAPFSDILVVEGCGVVPLRVPEGATRLEATLSGSAVSADGAGYMTLQMHAAGQPWIRPASVAPSERTVLVADAPAPGEWTLWAWPNGAVANQRWQLDVRLDGVGAMPEVVLDDPGAFC